MLNLFLKAKFAKLRLGPTLVSVFTLQVVAAVGVMGYVSFRGGQRAVNELSSQLRTELSARIERELRTYFEVPHQLNRLNAAAFSRGELDVVDAQYGEAHFYQQMKIAPNVAFVFCGSAQRGEFLGIVRSPEDRILELTFGNRATSFFREYYQLDVNGQRTYHIRRADRPYDARQRPWFAAALANDGPAWTDVYIAFSTGLPNITASLPVYDLSGRQLIGVCGTDVVLPEEFRTFLQELDIGQTGQAFVIDHKGALIANSTDEPLMKGEGDTAESLLASESQDEGVRQATQYLLDQYGSFEQINTAEQLEFYIQGQRQFLQVLPFRDDFGLDWLIVVTVPEADFMAQIYATTRNTAMLALISLAIAITGGVLVTRWIIGPILNLTTASDAMAQGNLAQQVNADSRFRELDTLARAFNSMAGQLKAFFARLEEKVQERTAELADANQKIVTLNTKLKAENLRMGAELDVARQIQQMILPKTEELRQVEGLDIAGFMEPAEEVGGDYYDVLQRDGVITVSIGDVTGHGLESGLLMLMTQTAVRTLQEVQEQNPVTFLDALNRTICHNVQRMNSEKNLTLVVLSHAQGQIRISGQHEEILLARSDGTIERIDTMDLGLPLGLDDDITEFIDDILIHLEPGDGVILYTDGIPEAYNAIEEQYSLERLCRVISEHWSGSAEQVKQAVITDFRDFIGAQKMADDITLVVLKQQ
ncbi:MAG: SpoIIE family protein phosphatase [Spirulina sp. SIO3F2]|nr:SpoIIE family protein phosphatase [Spirulina sp. SIO3F2]